MLYDDAFWIRDEAYLWYRVNPWKYVKRQALPKNLQDTRDYCTTRKNRELNGLLIYTNQ